MVIQFFYFKKAKEHILLQVKPLKMLNKIKIWSF